MQKKILFVAIAAVLGMFLFSCGTKQEKIVEIIELEEVVVKDNIEIDEEDGPVETLTWRLSNDTLFILSEPLCMASHVHIDDKCKNSITTVIVEEGVELLGHGFFADYHNLKCARFPESFIYLGWGGFLGCNKLDTIYVGNKLMEDWKTSYQFENALR